MHPISLFEFTYGKKNKLKDLRVGHHVMTSQYPVHIFTYGGIYSPLKHFFSLHQILSRDSARGFGQSEIKDYGSM